MQIIPEFLFNKFNEKNIIDAMKDYINSKNLRRHQIKHFGNFQDKMLLNNKNPSDVIINKLKI